ncbi:MAG: rane protein of unknown function [Candidatus Parcubacteria bacterium]|nr:rane protein of unknown function [Candidatus Parcubacteria bacterium]
MKLLVHWLVYAAAILITAYLLPGVTVGGGIISALILSVVLGAINLVLRPILILLTLPVTVVTLGLFVLVINALLVLLAASIVPGFAVANFWWAFLFAVILSLVMAVLGRIERAVEDDGEV